MDTYNNDTEKRERLAALLVECKGIVSDACRAFGISRQTFYEWVKKDSVFAEMVEEAKEAAIDYVEGKLFSQIGQGDTTAIIFFLKTRGRNRGYSERLEVTGKNGSPLFESIKVEIVNGASDKGD